MKKIKIANISLTPEEFRLVCAKADTYCRFMKSEDGTLYSTSCFSTTRTIFSPYAGIHTAEIKNAMLAVAHRVANWANDKQIIVSAV